MLRTAISLFLFTVIGSATAAESWDMVWVQRSTDWFVKQGKGDLNRSGGILSGFITGANGDKYQIKVILKRDKASGTFEVVPSDAGPEHLVGTYSSVRDGNTCWQTIQLYGGYNYVGLLRNEK